MNILLCYGYDPWTTAVYFEFALRKRHSLSVVNTPGGERAGRARNEDVYALVEQGVVPKPDLVIFIESGASFFPRGLEKFACPTVGYVIDVHTDFALREQYAAFFDHIFVCHKDYIPRFKAHGFENVHWLPVACDPSTHGQLAVERIYDVGFVGNVAATGERKHLLSALEQRFKLNDYRKYYPKEQLTEVYSRSKIVFNHCVNKDITMRVFEALAAGALLVSNPMENDIGALLTAGEHYIEYRDERSLIERVEHFLSHDAERERIAQAGRAAVLSRHTYDLRAHAMLETVMAARYARTAKVRRMNAPELRAAYGRVYSALRLVDAAFVEFDSAWRAKAGRLGASKALATTVLRRLNATLQLSQLIRSNARKSQTRG